MKKGSERFWYFYFDKTYAMEVYQFYHDETKTMENTSYLVNKKFTVESKYQNQNLVRNKDESFGHNKRKFLRYRLNSIAYGSTNHLYKTTFISDYNWNKCGFYDSNNKYYLNDSFNE
jgi:hypothetical protein